ncbi:hypothetical protein Bbelb_428370 [Branchiostoma belcheri]|nr:hypothetical protein Bbelb_435030 [Branchiostoma belcheri]KAI8479418.1 hypothetical protein Bbelb_428370 [Branchiostoma belcheri]
MTSMAILTCRPNSHPFQERRVLLTEAMKIGRSVARARPAPNNCIFDCKVLSRNHALLWFENSKFFLQDTKSSNGTFVNNQRLSKGSEESPAHEIHSGDIIQFGVDVMENSRKDMHVTWDRHACHLGQTCLSPGTDVHVTWDRRACHLGQTCLSPGTDVHVTWDRRACHLGQTCMSPGTDKHVTWDRRARHLGQTCRSPGTDVHVTWDRRARHLGQTCMSPGTDVHVTWDRRARHLGQTSMSPGTDVPVTWDRRARHLGQTCTSPGTNVHVTWDRRHLGQTCTSPGTDVHVTWDRCACHLGQTSPGTDVHVTWDRLGQTWEKTYLGIQAMTHGCIIAQIHLYNPDGTEFKPRNGMAPGPPLPLEQEPQCLCVN